MAQGQHLPYTNTRLLLASELEDDDSWYTPGVVVRLFSSPNSHPAVRQTLQGLHPRRVSLGALAVQSLVNKRGPDGVVGVIPGEDKHSARLLSLCQECHDKGEVLACSMPSADMVLVPRLPATAAQDGLYFLAYATNLRAVELCERLRQQKQVAMVLDLDNTLVDAVSCTIAPNDWDLLDWHYVLVTNSYRRQIKAQYAPLPGYDSFSDDVWVMHWKVGRMNCTFKVRVRRGWADLREFLVQNAHKYEVFVCSKGKREYIQLLWLMLDPRGQLIPESDWDARLTSTFPDTLNLAANKTALTALGCYDITKPHVSTQVALPMICLDDSTEAYDKDYEHSIMYVQEYRPSDLLESDNGNVLRQVRGRLEAFWTATCASDGTFAWQAAQSFAMALMGTMQRNPMGSPDDLSYLQVRCAKQGEALWHQFTVREVFGEDGVFLADNPLTDVPRQGYVTAGSLLCSTCHLPECKPECPGTSASLAGEPSGPAELAARLAGSPTAASAARAAAAEDAAHSEGRSSEDSLLLGQPSPIFSVLHEDPTADSTAVMAESSGDSSPTAEPKPKQQRMDAQDNFTGWGAQLPAATTSAAADARQRAATAPPVITSGGWLGAHEEHQQAALPAATPAPAVSVESALAAALRGISKGLEEERISSLPPQRPLQQAAAPDRQQASAPGGSGSSLSAALAAISKGLMEDGLM